MRKFTRKTLAVSTAVVLLTGGGAAYAYWTAGGSGSGTAETATSTTISVQQTSDITDLKPGGAAQTLFGNFHNTNTNPIFVTSVTATIASVTKAAGAPAGVCTPADYTLANPVMMVNDEIAVGVDQGAWTGATIAFNNNRGGAPINQDGCKGAHVLLAYSAL